MFCLIDITAGIKNNTFSGRNARNGDCQGTSIVIVQNTANDVEVAIFFLVLVLYSGAAVFAFIVVALYQLTDVGTSVWTFDLFYAYMNLLLRMEYYRFLIISSMYSVVDDLPPISTVLTSVFVKT